MNISRCLLILGLTASLTAACSGSSATSPAEKPAVGASAGELRDTHERTHSVLWMQTAAEYWTLTQTAFERASLTLDRALANKKWTAALEQEGIAGYSKLPPAVIMDLDETVLDNSRFQGQLVLDRTDYLSSTWSEWVAKASAPSVPGAVEFIKIARSKGVHVMFVTNRTANEEKKTIENLDRLLGTATDPEDVLCSRERDDWSSDKTTRRKYVAEKYRILLLVGDDLNDFVSVADVKTPADRVMLAKTHAAFWRDRWVLITNPVYGSWERVLYQDLKEPKDPDILLKKRAMVNGFK